MSYNLSTDLTIHADNREKRQFLADLLGCYDFDYPSVFDYEDAGLGLSQEDRGYVEHLLPAVDAICQALAARGLKDLAFSIDGSTDCDYGVYCVFEIQVRDGEAYCRETELDTNEFDPEEAGADPDDDPLSVALESASEDLQEHSWTEIGDHWAVQDPLRPPFEDDQLQKADEIISAYLSTL